MEKRKKAMHTDQGKKGLRRALIAIFIYIALVNVGDALGEAYGLGSVITALLVLALASVLVKKHARKELGLIIPSLSNLQKWVYFLPLALMVLVQWVAGLEPGIGAAGVGEAALLMLGVGFVEEVLFRGMLFQAIEKTSTTRRAVIISGVTFGLGHIVNLLRGYSASELAGQIVLAIVIGILLSLLMARTRSVVVGAVFHILFNFSGTVTNQGSESQGLFLIGLLLISLGTIVLLLRPSLQKKVVVS
jgi:membrane protease YdiL (CAAX protease family)